MVDEDRWLSKIVNIRKVQLTTLKINRELVERVPLSNTVQDISSIRASCRHTSYLSANSRIFWNLLTKGELIKHWSFSVNHLDFDFNLSTKRSPASITRFDDQCEELGNNDVI